MFIFLINIALEIISSIAYINIIIPTIWNANVPVSYTHLDVYKRQLSCNSQYVLGIGIIIGWFGIQFAAVIPLLHSDTCSACIVLIISGINLPTFIGYTNIVLIIPLSSIIYTFLTVSVLLISFDIIPYFLAISPFLSAIIGNDICIPVLQYISYTHARCDALLSILNPSNSVFSSLKYVCALVNAIISVVHTGVKSPGCENKTNHLPL